MAHKQKTIDDYIRTCDAAVVPLLTELRAFIMRGLPGATEGMRYGVPAFTNAHGVPVIYLFGSKRHVNFGFLQSADVDDPTAVLKGSGRPSKHIRIYPGKPYDVALLSGFIDQCAQLKTDRT